MRTLTAAGRLAYGLAESEAEKLGGATIEVEHLFIALCKLERIIVDNKDDLSWMAKADERTVRDEIGAYSAVLEAMKFDSMRGKELTRTRWSATHSDPTSFTGHRSVACREVFKWAESLNRETTGLSALLWAVLVAPGPIVESVLTDLGVERAQLAGGLAELARAGLRGTTAVQSSHSDLARFGRDLTALAREGKLRPAIGRNPEIKQIARTLLHAKKPNPMLVGDPGVGKTAIVEGLALAALRPDLPDKLHDIHLYEISLGALVAGTEFRGEFEKRLDAVIRAAERDPRVVLFIDEVHMLLGAGSAGGGSMDAANLLKPALARGSIRCIGATTTTEYRKHIERDGALERRFEVIWIDEPTRAQAVEILQGIRPSLEMHHGVRIADEALTGCVDLSIRYLADFRLPDKAIDLVDQACARVALPTLSPGKRPPTDEIVVGPMDVAQVVSLRCRVPIDELTEDEAQRLTRLEERLRKRVVGQESALEAVSESIRAARAGLKDPRRPVGVFLFLGPTGTGKTELAKALAEALFGDEHRLIRFDMSEFAERHSIAKLIGAPPGYIGHDEGGALVDRIRTTPYAVVLFDEIEKAHPEVLNLFLQVFDDGQLTDARGRVGSFRESVIIMTSNLGASIAFAPPPVRIGFKTTDQGPAHPSHDVIDVHTYEARLRGAARERLTPELRNRISKEIVFYPLQGSDLDRILDKLLTASAARLLDKKIHIDVEASARQLLIESGYSIEFGARQLERTVVRAIEEPLAAMIVAGRLHPGTTVRVSGREGNLVFDLNDPAR